MHHLTELLWIGLDGVVRSKWLAPAPPATGLPLSAWLHDRGNTVPDALERYGEHRLELIACTAAPQMILEQTPVYLAHSRDEWCPRTLLEQEVSIWENTLELSPLMGTESEFCLTQGRALDRDPLRAYASEQGARELEWVHALTQTLAQTATPVALYHAESARSRFELGLAPSSPVAAADGQVLLRRAATHYAWTQGGHRLAWSYRGNVGEHNSPLHVHLSAGERDDWLRPALTGVWHYRRWLQVFLSPSPESWQRVGAFRVRWGYEERNAIIRSIPGRAPRVEVRHGDHSGSPHLAMWAILRAARAGIEADGPSSLPPAGEDDGLWGNEPLSEELFTAGPDGGGVLAEAAFALYRTHAEIAAATHAGEVEEDAR